jgi:hypothetical protein
VAHVFWRYYYCNKHNNNCYDKINRFFDLYSIEPKMAGNVGFVFTNTDLPKVTDYIRLNVFMFVLINTYFEVDKYKTYLYGSVSIT